MKIGIPRALLYYYYIPFWQTFFEELKVEVVISDETNKSLLNKGISQSVAEICVPIKIFVGHLSNLSEKQVDYIFVPRMVSIYEGEYFCPKFMGLPDMVKHGLEGLEDKILTCSIESDHEDISDYKHYLPLIEPLRVTEEEMKQAAIKAKEVWDAFRMYSKMGMTIPESLEMVSDKPVKRVIKSPQNQPVLRLGLLGYVYNIYDDFVSMNITQRLRELGVEFITFEMMEEQLLDSEVQDMDKRMFWTFSNKLLGAGYHLFSDEQVDGVIQLTAFGCGPDSFLSTLFEMKSDETGIPFMMIRVDEHTGENHLQTRIEAFIDMIRRKKCVG